ncbi:type III secretion system chaperone [Bordetella sp. 15P40C-2]|uniref:type III secretion system chaperone n=1 Tax=Bordetella sp. 15P40C-2 TaxID=2572246 RepID=UPI0013280256|nr:type III secretion system chaperone [Bordetella sp. 15P40C-2]MVW70948.1 hypothetical protein [Bordetella sp. 15P40C-2]
MLSNVDPRAVLRKFGQGIGITDLALDAEGHCYLSFDEMVVEIRLHEEAGRFTASSQIATLPPKVGELLLTRYHALNYLGLVMGTGAIGADPSTLAVHYLQHIPLRGLDETIFSKAMTMMVNRVEKLTHWLATEPPEAAVSSENERMNAFMLSLHA